MILTRAEYDALPDGLRPKDGFFRLPDVANLSELVTLLYEEGEQVKAERDALQAGLKLADALAEVLLEALDNDLTIDEVWQYDATQVLADWR